MLYQLKLKLKNKQTMNLLRNSEAISLEVLKCHFITQNIIELYTQYGYLIQLKIATRFFKWSQCKIILSDNIFFIVLHQECVELYSSHYGILKLSLEHTKMPILYPKNVGYFIYSKMTHSNFLHGSSLGRQIHFEAHNKVSFFRASALCYKENGPQCGSSRD